MMDFLRKNLWWMSALAAIFIYFGFIKVNPCSSPVGYKIGRVDPGFKLSETKLLASVQQAGNIWSKSVGKNLFEYDPNGKLTLNLIYDDRQKTTQMNTLLKADVAKTSNLADSVRQEYEGLMQELANDKQVYSDELSNYQAKQNAYSNQVTYWNNNGGAPQDEYNKLQAEKQSLLSEQQILETKRVALNNAADNINAFIQKYNLLVQSANANIDTINQTAGQEFQEGSYDPNTNTINIYEYSTQDKLERVLAHELGHALGLNHNNNPDSIMYALNQSNTLVLSKDDISSLKTLCKMQ